MKSKVIVQEGTEACNIGKVISVKDEIEIKSLLVQKDGKVHLHRLCLFT